MRATLLPDMDARISTGEAQRIRQDLIVEMLNTKGVWLDHHLKRILPPRIYAMAHDYSAPYEAFESRQAQVQEYLKKQDIRLEEHGVNARLFKGNVLVSQFFVKLAEE